MAYRSLSRRLVDRMVPAVGVLILAGCANGVTDAADGRLVDYIGSLATSFGLDERDGRPERSADDLRWQRAIEDFIASCMQERGFEYVPESPESLESVRVVEEALALPREEFIAQYGYGISTDDTLGSGAESAADPNTEIREGLSPQAQQAYDRALWGTSHGDDGHDAPDPEGGCQGRAVAHLSGSGGKELAPFPGEATLLSDLAAFGERLDRDTRVVDARERWSECMAESGYSDLDRPEDAPGAVTQRMMDQFGFAGSRLYGFMEGTEPQNLDPAALAELRKYELSLAAADHACQRSHYLDAVEAVQRELEAEFIREHRDQLESYRDWLGSKDTAS